MADFEILIEKSGTINLGIQDEVFATHGIMKSILTHSRVITSS